MDERICSGSYFAKAFRVFKNYLANPELLETPPAPEKVILEVPYKKIKAKHLGAYIQKPSVLAERILEISGLYKIMPKVLLCFEKTACYFKKFKEYCYKR